MEQNQQSPVFDQQPDQQPSAPQYEPYVPIMGFGQAVKTCFKKYFDFKGRARRSEYWWFNLFNCIVTFIWSLIASFISPMKLPIFEGASVPYCSSNLTMAEPTITPSASLLMSLA